MIYIIACMIFNFSAIVYLLILTYLQDNQNQKINKELLNNYKSIIKNYEYIVQKSFILEKMQKEKNTNN